MWVDMDAGFHGTSNSSGSPSRSTTGSHELEDTYGAYRLRADAPGVLSGAPGARHTVGSVAPSSFWLEHRAAAHHTASGEPRSSMQKIRTLLRMQDHDHTCIISQKKVQSALLSIQDVQTYGPPSSCLQMSQGPGPRSLGNPCPAGLFWTPQVVMFPGSQAANPVEVLLLSPCRACVQGP